MNLVEFLGFIAMLFFLLHSARNTKRNRVDPDVDDAEEQEQAKRLREFLQGVDTDMKEISAPKPKSTPKPQSVKREKLQWEHQAAKHLQRSQSDSEIYKDSPDPYAMEKDAYAITKKKKSRAFYLRQKLKNPQEMVIMYEIMGSPKALKNERSKHSLPY